MRTQTHEAGGPGVDSEATSFQQAQAGCSVSLNALMKRHDGLTQTVVRQQVLGDLSFVEALQAGRIGLWQAILGFDPSRGFAFSTYAWPSIQRRVWRAVERHTRLYTSSEIPGLLLPLLGRGGGATPSPLPGPERIWEAAQVHRALHALLRRSPPRLRYVIVARYGLNGHSPSF